MCTRGTVQIKISNPSTKTKHKAQFPKDVTRGHQRRFPPPFTNCKKANFKSRVSLSPDDTWTISCMVWYGMVWYGMVWQARHVRSGQVLHPFRVWEACKYYFRNKRPNSKEPSEHIYGKNYRTDRMRKWKMGQPTRDKIARLESHSLIH